MTVYDYNYDLAIREVGDQIVVTNNLGRTALYSELVKLGGVLGFVMEPAGIANGATGRIAPITSGFEFSTAQVEATDTFTAGNIAYFEPGGSSAAGTIVDTATATTTPIGKIISEQGAGGAQTAVNIRGFDQLGAADAAKLASSVKVARVEMDAAGDYSVTGKAANIPLGSIILDVFAVATASNSSGTVQPFMGSSAVCAALATTTDGAVARMATSVDDTKLVVTAAVTVKAHAANETSIVTILYV